MAFISPINIIKGMIQIIEVNLEPINELIKHYRPSDALHVFEGLRSSLPLSSYPSLELEPDSGSSTWVTTTAQDCEYNIRCILTLNCQNDELGAEYVSEVTRKIIQIFNYPSNMTFIIPNEYQGLNGEPVWAQFGYIDSVSYGATKSGSIRQSDWVYSCKVIEIYDYWNLSNGPKKLNFKDDTLLGE